SLPRPSRASRAPLSRQVGQDDGQSGDVAARPGEASDEAGRYRITDGCHDDRRRRRCVLDGSDNWRPPGRHNEVHLETHELGGEVWKRLILPVRRSVVDDDSLAFHETDLAERLPKRVEIWFAPRIS